MRLSKLHINGFKSFPDRAELGFDHGVTAIVGPNGCGKSNVVDAITWVLGEQSAKSLRGDRMEDVIFNGSDARKPTATAEVRLKLADVAQAAMPGVTDPNEFLDDTPLLTRDVEIGRRLYRSGESEYLIDGQVCRLRDVHDLLMDSGLGVKAYAVIEQGKIGQILSSRPAERRNLIEEAAGVTKYKSRRRSAELKLEAAQQNLTRIDDIIFEVEKQRNALKRQAARARRYKRLREELRRWEQVQFARKHRALAGEIETAEARLTEARAREAAASARVAQLETGLEALRLDLTTAEASATATREEAHARELQIGRREQQTQFETQQVSDLTARVAELGAEARELEGRREPARTALESQRETVAHARQSLADAAHGVEACQLEYSRALAAVQGIETDADETRASVMASTTTLSALRQARDNATAVRDRVAAERSRLEIESRDLDVEAARARHERDQAVQALAGAREALEAATQQRAGVEASLAKQRSEHDELSDAQAMTERALAGHEARLRSLEEMEARRATFGEAARFLLAEGASGIRQHGAVADHLDVERSYERAVDALLGDILQHVIVDSASEVHQALSRLTAVSAGRCGFVVLDGAAEEAAAPRLAFVPEGARLLRDVVRVNGPHADVIATLLGDALIVESFEGARSIARDVAVPVATVQGEVFHGAHLVEIGSRPDVHGILETRGDIDRLRDEIAAGESEVRRIASAAYALEIAIGADELKLGDHVATQHTQEKAIVGFESQLAHGDEESARVSRRLELVATERRRAEEEERTADTRREGATAAITDYEARQEGAEGRLHDVIVRLQAARADAESKLRLVTEARTAQATLNERASALDMEGLRLEAAARDLDERLAQRQAEIARTETRIAELRQSIQDTARLLDEDIRVIENLKIDLRGLDERLASLRGQFGSREQEIRGGRHAYESVRAEVTHSEVARATAASDLAHLASACQEAINVSIEEVLVEVARMEREGELVAPAKRIAALAALDEDEDAGDAELGAIPTLEIPDPQNPAVPPGTLEPGTPEPGTPAGILPSSSVEEIVAELRRKIEKLGPVNMMAIEQFDELESRHTFLTTQRKDLLDSIAQTGEAIRKIDKTTRERFEEAFVSINTNFEATFTTLFGGGRAGLVLIDQENETESGIDIIAQPPGKRLQNVQLLSGGEKALTAMALMFAIFKYRPSPFCLLDEIDAPLDDANIGRFVEMLQSMQSHTQFILITHNRKTMEIADRLYGVTMEEPGVSKLISLQF